MDFLIEMGIDMWVGIEYNGADWVYSENSEKLDQLLSNWKYDEAPIPSKDGYNCVKH